MNMHMYDRILDIIKKRSEGLDFCTIAAQLHISPSYARELSYRCHETPPLFRGLGTHALNVLRRNSVTSKEECANLLENQWKDPSLKPWGIGPKIEQELRLWCGLTCKWRSKIIPH